ncbi:MAG: hypothetical protein QOJ56_5414 [Mycobacterium sp.]|nr:hypothetical protein [Mycobacterium sp.]
MKSIITFERAGPHDDVVLTCTYDRDALAVIKNIPAWARTWQPRTRCWAIHPRYVRSLATALRRVGFTVEETDTDRIAAPKLCASGGRSKTTPSKPTRQEGSQSQRLDGLAMMLTAPPPPPAPPRDPPAGRVGVGPSAHRPGLLIPSSARIERRFGNGRTCTILGSVRPAEPRSGLPCGRGGPRRARGPRCRARRPSTSTSGIGGTSVSVPSASVRQGRGRQGRGRQGRGSRPDPGRQDRGSRQDRGRASCRDNSPGPSYRPTQDPRSHPGTIAGRAPAGLARQLRRPNPPAPKQWSTRKSLHISVKSVS